MTPESSQEHAWMGARFWTEGGPRLDGSAMLTRYQTQAWTGTGLDSRREQASDQKERPTSARIETSSPTWETRSLIFQKNFNPLKVVFLIL